MSQELNPHQDIFGSIKNNDSYSTTLKLCLDMYNKQAYELLKQNTAIQYIQNLVDKVQQLDPKTCSPNELIYYKVLIECAKVALPSTISEKSSGDLMRVDEILKQKIEESIKDQKKNTEERRKAELEKKLEQERQAEQKHKEDQAKKEAEAAKKSAELAAKTEVKNPEVKSTEAPTLKR